MSIPIPFSFPQNKAKNPLQIYYYYCKAQSDNKGIQLIDSGMEGYLQFWQGYISRWSKYYFRIHEELLLFGPNKQEVEGRIHLKVAQVISKLDDPVSLMLHTGTQTLYIRAYSIDEKVKWYKKLKEVQKQVTDHLQNKQLFKMKMELNKMSRFKILDDLNTELWRCHAELQQRLQQVIVKTKNVMVMKNIDRLRMSVDQFKYKTSQMLQYIDEEIRDMKNKEQSGNVTYQSKKQSSEQGRRINFDQYIQHENVNDTHFYSFYGDTAGKTNNANNKNKSKRKPQMEEIYQQAQSFSSLQLDLRQRKSMQQTPNPKRKDLSSSIIDTEHERNAIKKKLFNQNKVYQKIGKIFSNYDSRNSLPQKFTPEQKFPLIGTFASALTSGADLTKITMPVTTNQPISALQKSCEQIYYSQLLQKADETNDQNLRMLYVLAFAVSTYSLNDGRVKKPFNPLLGQTFQFIDQNKGIQFLAEQVSHHPPISAFYIKSDNYQIFDNTKSTVSFAGNSIKVTPQSKTVIKLERHNDFYVFNKCVVALGNILLGKTSVQIYGEITMKCKDYNTQAVLEFQQDSMWKSSQAFRIVGNLVNQGKITYQIEGYWNKQLIATNVETKQKMFIWRKSHQINPDYYNFNQLTLKLNHLSVQNYKNLPPTDSRFRPDQRALEYRYLDLASQQKNRLQNKQRKRKKQNQESKQQHKVLWFIPSILQGEEVYMSNQHYWDQKIKGNWKECLDIF